MTDNASPLARSGIPAESGQTGSRWDSRTFSWEFCRSCGGAGWVGSRVNHEHPSCGHRCILCDPPPGYDRTYAKEPAAMPDTPITERMVLVGRIYSHMATTWREWDRPFEEVIEEIKTRALDGKVNASPDEIVEVIIVRRARVRGEITVEVEAVDA